MKLLTFLLITCSLILSTNVQAEISCSEPKLSKPSDHDSLYHFKAVVICKLVNETINLKAVKDAYLEEIVSKGSQFKVHHQKNYNDQKGMTGYSLDVTQSYTSPNGDMQVHASIIIADDLTKHFKYELRSKSIDAEGDAKFDKTIVNKATLELQPNGGELKLIKEIDVEKPWYAPEGIFYDKVEPELEESTRKAALLNAQKICGQKVEALRK
jgi:hypothetical protein